MYTEDDDKVKVKKDNSSTNYDDFYTSFNDLDSNQEKKDHKDKKNKKVSSKSEKVKDEMDYSSFYDTNDAIEETKDHGKRNKIIIAIVLVLLLVGLVVGAIFIFKNKKEEEKDVPGDIELVVTEFNLTSGASEYVSYKIVDTEVEIKTTYTSSNPAVATVDETGKITAVGPGEANITIKYSFGGKEKEKVCLVRVTEPIDNTPHELNLNLRFNNGSDGSWTNKDVTISVDASTDIGLSSLKYAVNCNGECAYNDVSENKIVVTDNGTTKITVVATDTRGQAVTKEVTVKIDKEAPNITFNNDKNIESNKDIEVCATCSDNISGCKQNKVCKKYSSTKSNQTITVTDNAGNSTKSPVFNVTIAKQKAPCELKVSNDGTVTATLRESANYYGFNSTYSGSNELSQKVDINASKAGESGAKVVRYYVLNKNGSGGMCYLTVIKECVCTDKNSTDPNCAVTCTYRAS